MSKHIPLLLCSLIVGAAQPAHATDTLMPRVVHEACGDFEKGKSVEILARFEDESQLFDPKVIYRTRTDSHWKHAAFAKDEGTEDFRAVIKARELRGALEYFIEVFDEYGNGPARMGSPEAPIRMVPVREATECRQIPLTARAVTVTEGSKMDPFKIGPPPPPKDTCDMEDRPLYCEAWLWAAVGTVVAAGTATAIYFIAFADPEKDPPPPDSVNLTVTGPDILR